MNKYKRLLEKVELFHRLAVYGTRDGFLRVISQDNENEEKEVESTDSDSESKAGL